MPAEPEDRFAPSIQDLAVTRDGQRLCTACNNWRPTDEFVKSPNGRELCEECFAAVMDEIIDG